MRGDAADRIFTRERQDGVRRPARLECTDALQVFTLEKDLATEQGIQRRTMYDRRAMHPAGYPPGGGQHVFRCRRLPVARESGIAHDARKSWRR
jgi:hypothetical protein